MAVSPDGVAERMSPTMQGMDKRQREPSTIFQQPPDEAFP
jgi:hypothetical protein